MPAGDYFQLHMPGDLCFGCGTHNPNGLQIKSYWDGDDAVCVWQAEESHQGWKQLTCGGIIATIVDCHCIATAMATAYRNEERGLDSEPRYLFATGSLNIKYLQPTPIHQPLVFRARTIDIQSERKYLVRCELFVDAQKTAEADVVVFLVYRSDQPEKAAAIFRPGEHR